MFNVTTFFVWTGIFHYLLKIKKGDNSTFARELPPIPIPLHNLNAWNPRGTGSFA